MFILIIIPYTILSTDKKSVAVVYNPKFAARNAGFLTIYKKWTKRCYKMKKYILI